MRSFTVSEFRKCEAEFSEAVLRSPDLSPFCSGPVWQWAAHDSLHGEEDKSGHLIYEDGGNWVVFAEQGENALWFPFESAWMFGCPLVGSTSACLELLAAAVRERGMYYRAFCIGGVKSGGELHRLLRERRSRIPGYREFPMSEAMVVELGGGSEAWLARRSKKFRKSLRQSLQVVGIEIDDVRAESPARIFERLKGIQEQTYKWSEGTDIFQSGNYEAFYRDILDRLSASGDLRFLVAHQDRVDIAYIFGGIFGETYRGFQMSFVESARDLGIGNRLQWENMLRCEREGIVRYDLGMHAPYKERWADRRDDYLAILVAFPPVGQVSI